VRLAVAEPSAHKKSAAGPRAAPCAKPRLTQPIAEPLSGLPLPTKRAQKSAAGPRAAPYAKAVSASPTAETPSGLPLPTKRCTKVRNWVARGPYAKPVSPSPTAEPLNRRTPIFMRRCARCAW